MKKPLLVGVIHLPPLPGSPRARSYAREIAALAVSDAKILFDEGYDLAMIENFGDAPFFRGKVPDVTVSAMTVSVIAVRTACPALPLGVNVLRNDADAALAIAAACDAACIRVNVHTGARVTDQGLIEGEAATTVRTRRALGADRVEIWADVDVKHSAALAPRSLTQEAHDLATRGMADVLLVTGEGTGRAVDVTKLEEVRRAVSGTRVLVASGATAETLPLIAPHCDGVIVGSALRAGGLAGGPIDRAAAAAFADAYRSAFPRPSL